MKVAADGAPLMRSGEEVSIKLGYRPVAFFKRELVRPKYADPRQPEMGVRIAVIANMYFRSRGLDTLGDDDSTPIGMSEETNCYVTPECLVEADPFADFVVHEAAHIFHYCKRGSFVQAPRGGSPMQDRAV